ncbi:hypothetical protein [Nostoc sp.]|uniref:hypothetical protein n=1 Tax=Nostoc sp. TaxID=1180 RepID=UPI002FFC0E32
MLQDKEPKLFEEFVPKKKMRRLMLISNASQEKYLTLAKFDQEAALEALCQGQTVIPFWCDRVHQQLRDNLKNFGS